jgi:cytidylate kinase
MPWNIALDGPSGAGKSSIAKRLARALNLLHVDTGAMYRAVGLKFLRAGIPPDDEAAIAALCLATDVDVALSPEGQRTLLDGEDVTDLIRTPDVSLAASTVSKVGAVRARMLTLQQGYAARLDLIMDGRDIGTRVLPNANVKIFLTASPQERARRRYLELAAQGAPDTQAQVLADMNARDAQDATRALDPLTPAPDARIIDTTGFSPEEVTDMILEICTQSAARSPAQ